MKPDSTIRALEHYIKVLNSNGEMLTDILIMISEHMSSSETDEEFVDRLYEEIDNE